MNVSSTTALTRELNPLEAPFLPTDDPQFLWLKYQILMYFEDRLKTIEVRPEDPSMTLVVPRLFETKKYSRQ